MGDWRGPGQESKPIEFEVQCSILHRSLNCRNVGRIGRPGHQRPVFKTAIEGPGQWVLGKLLLQPRIVSSFREGTYFSNKLPAIRWRGLQIG